MCIVIRANALPQLNNGYNYNQNAFNRPQALQNPTHQNLNQANQQQQNQVIFLSEKTLEFNIVFFFQFRVESFL